MKEAVEWSSSLVPHSFSSSVISVGRVLLLSCSVSGKLISTCSGVCGLCPLLQRGVLPIFSLCMCVLRRQWPVLNRNIVVWKFLGRSCLLSLRYLMLILFFLAFLVLFFRSVFVSWKEILAGGCGLDDPSLASLSASSFPNSPQWAGIHCRAKVLLVCSCSCSSKDNLDNFIPSFRLKRLQAFHSSAENSAIVNFLHGRIPKNPRSHPIELPLLVQDSPVAIFQGCQDFRDSTLGPNWVKFCGLVWVPVLSPRLWPILKAPSRNQFMRNSDRRKQSRRLLEWPEICAC